jgi:hypothetical protein
MFSTATTAFSIFFHFAVSVYSAALTYNSSTNFQDRPLTSIQWD